MDQPEEFVDGFDIKAVIGALFVGFVMMPGAIYLGLIAGQSLGPAAEWTTVILFTDVARRSFVTLKRQEIYILFYIASSLASMQGGLALAGGAFAGKIFDQYLVRSPAFRGLGIANDIPSWVVPGPNSEAIAQRTFLHKDWLVPSLLLVLGTILGRFVGWGMGYIVFRITSDYQRLPFPFAAISAQGATALSESSTKEETWRWRTFSIGAMVGLVFGAFYVGIPRRHHEQAAAASADPVGGPHPEYRADPAGHAHRLRDRSRVHRLRFRRTVLGCCWGIPFGAPDPDFQPVHAQDRRPEQLAGRYGNH